MARYPENYRRSKKAAASGVHNVERKAVRGRPSSPSDVPRSAFHAPPSSWESVAGWYNEHTSSGGTLIADVVHPGTVRLLAAEPGWKHLDVACGEGSLSRLIAKHGVIVEGFDASPSLIQLATQKAPHGTRYLVADATDFGGLFAPQSFSSATCTLALQNIERFEATIRILANVLKPGAPFVFVLNHPCFRIPRQSAWGWDEARKLQYRRVDKYLSSYSVEILAHPGANRSVKTFSYHRPLSVYIDVLAKNGFMVEKMEEWVSNRESKPGGHGKAENIAREEIPMFLAVRSIKK